MIENSKTEAGVFPSPTSAPVREGEGSGWPTGGLAGATAAVIGCFPSTDDGREPDRPEAMPMTSGSRCTNRRTRLPVACSGNRSAA
jgi:hypothetical protein